MHSYSTVVGFWFSNVFATFPCSNVLPIVLRRIFLDRDTAVATRRTSVPAMIWADLGFPVVPCVFSVRFFL